jgi:cyclopropane fatty-acyl-phospholipid synthase-like methyltransferase
MSSSRSFYSRYWETPGEAFPDKDPLTPTKVEHLREILERRPGSKVVDAGCGSGGLTRRYAGAAGEVIALELSARAVELANAANNLDHVQYVEADLQDTWPVADGWADLVVSSEVIEHLFEFPTYLAELSRVTARGGLLYLTTPYHGLIKNLVLAVRGFDRHFCSYEGGHIRFFTDAKLRQLAHEYGFTDVKFRHLGRIGPLAMSTVMTARRA